MSKKQLVILALIVCLPLILLVWFAARVARNEQQLVRQQLRDLLMEQLRETDRTVIRHFQRRQRDYLDLSQVESWDASQLRALIREEPQIQQLFVLEADGKLRHPSLVEPLNESERQFLERAGDFLEDKDLVLLAGGEGESTASLPSSNPTASVRLPASSGTAPHGWYVWYWGRGVNLVFWHQLESGRIVGIELDRSRWMADLIAQLPDTALDPALQTRSRIQLIDSNDETIYQWGEYEPSPDEHAFVELPLSPPLASWRLKYHVPKEQFVALAPSSGYVSLVAGVSAAAISLLVLAVAFYRESSREMREAATRVNFVNQVSHELKTPLTNIRMYAELLEQDLNNAPEVASEIAEQRLQVIISESGRLSRLINNVLNFARQQRQQAVLKCRIGSVDATVHAVLRQFGPSLQQQQIEVHFDGQAAEPVSFDPDVLEQILVNLISNVEKHAASGKRLDLATRQTLQQTTITVEDQGPGIPQSEQEHVFQPFYRLSDRLEGATGTGIGLAIVRSLARLHGGDVVCLPSRQAGPSGLRLQVTLRTNPP